MISDILSVNARPTELRKGLILSCDRCREEQVYSGYCYRYARGSADLHTIVSSERRAHMTYRSEELRNGARPCAVIRHCKLRPVCERETGLRSLSSVRSVQTALSVRMEGDGGFQTQFASVMENVLKAAVGEATKLFERTLQTLRAELVHLRQENVELKSGALAHQFKTRLAAEGAQRTEATAGPPRRDVGVQCEKPLMVERCCSPAPIGLQLPDIASDGLADLCSSAAEDGNRQLALLLIKKEPQETDCDDYSPGYFLLKQEGAEPILVRKEPFKNTMERVPIPSTFQTVSRCYGNPREISTASTSSTTNPAPTTNTVSCSNSVDYSNNKVTQTTTLSATDVGRTMPKASRRVLDKNTECSECGRILSNASSLENHMRLHRGPLAQGGSRQLLPNLA
ncbi:hypothetical protein AOLI_G00019560 [Acnodon oligacanthus]